MEKVVVDTNILVKFFLKTSLTNKAKNVIEFTLTEYSPVIFTNIFEGATFIEKNGYSDLFIYRKFLEFLNILILENKCGIDIFKIL